MFVAIHINTRKGYLAWLTEKILGPHGIPVSSYLFFGIFFSRRTQPPDQIGPVAAPELPRLTATSFL